MRWTAALVFGLLWAGCEGCETGVDCREDAEACPGAEECFVNGDTSGCAVRCNLEDTCDQGEACLLVDDLEGQEAGACFPLTDERLVGTDCDDDTQCASGICEGGADDKVCRGACDLDDDQCPDGTRCTLVGVRAMCLAPAADNADGETCEGPQECASGICVSAPHLADGDLDHAVCTGRCDGSICPDGQDCLALAVGINVCLAGVPEGEPCDSHDQCPQGRCITDSDPQVNDDTARCRLLCDTDDSCLGQGRACVPLDDGSLQVCMPVYENAGLSYPDATTVCTSGRQCLSGRCGSFPSSGVGGPEEKFCAIECNADADPVCPADSICWPYGDDPDDGLCGPIP